MSHGLFLSWAPFSRRTETLAAAFGLDARFVTTPWPKRPWTVPLKYPWQTGATAAVLATADVGELWVMDPPLPAVATVAAAARLRRAPLVVDMHTVAFYAREWRLLRPLELPLLRRASAVLVTNESLAGQVRGWGAPAFVLPDPLPFVPAGVDASALEPDLVTVVATYSKDEPIEILPTVARALPEARIAVTGRARGDLSGWPPNLRPTGFLEDIEYWRQLARSAVVVVLTTRPETLLSGGYEALAVGRPLVTSDHAVLREYFGDAALYARDGHGSLEVALRVALDAQAEYAARAASLADTRRAEWTAAADTLRSRLGRADV
jgi:glycosyltransferase involved in cell wall biosynthesis